jgi:hypothetical protein
MNNHRESYRPEFEITGDGKYKIIRKEMRSWGELECIEVTKEHFSGPLEGKPASIESYNASGELFSRIEYQWDPETGKLIKENHWKDKEKAP